MKLQNFRPQRRNRARRGFSLMELLIVVTIMLILAAIAVPSYNRAQMNVHETAAVKQITTLHTAQAQYMSQFGRYAASLTELGPPASGAEGPSGAALIPGDLAKGTKTGYLFTMQGNEGGYVIQAQPVSFNGTGRRTFYADQNGITHQNWGKEPATAQSPEFK